MTIHLIALIVCISTSILAQLTFKGYYIYRKFYLLCSAISFFILTIPFTYLAVRGFGIGRVYVAAALIYVLAPLGARVIFKESISQRHWLAMILIVCGVAIYNLPQVPL